MPTIYEYSDLKSFVLAYMKARRKKQPVFSYRWLAKRLGLKSHAHIGAIIRGEKTATPNLMSKFFAIMGLQGEELFYAKTLLSLQAAKSEDERQFLAKKVEALRGENRAKELPGHATAFIESWYHAAILELIGMPLWHEDPKVIAKYLRNELSAKQVSESIKLLLDLGLVKRDDDGRLERVAEAFISTNNVPSPAIRSFHKQMLTKAIRAVDELTVHERFILGHTLPIHKSRLKEAQQLIFEFQRSLHNLMQSPDGDEVYQLAVQFFPLTDLQKYGPTISR